MPPPLPPTVIQKTRDGRSYWANQTATGVPYWDVPDQFRVEYALQGREITRVVDVPWGLQQQFVQDMRGYPTLVPMGSGLSRSIPDQFPQTKIPNMWCISARFIEGIGTPFVDSESGAFDYYIPQDAPYTDGQIPPGGFSMDGDEDDGEDEDADDDEGTEDDEDGHPGNPSSPIGAAPENAPYGYARYVLTYRRPFYDLLTDEEIANLPTDPTQGPQGELNRYVERREEYAVENLSIKGQSYYWADLSSAPPVGPPLLVAVNQDVVIRQNTKLLCYIWHEVPAVPEPAIETCLDTINSVTFDGRYPPGTLLFQAPKKERMEDVNGNIVWRIVYTWLYLGAGHNNLYRNAMSGKQAGYYLVTTDGKATFTGTNSIYKSADHNTVFQL